MVDLISGYYLVMADFPIYCGFHKCEKKLKVKSV